MGLAGSVPAETGWVMESRSGSSSWDAFGGADADDRLGALLRLGDDLRDEGSARESVQAALAARELALAREDDRAVAEAWTQVGRAYVELDEQAAARDALVQAARCWEALLEWQWAGNCLLGAFDSARSCGAVGNDDEERLRTAYTLLCGAGFDDAAAFAAVRLAEVEARRGGYDAAVELLDQARALAGSNVERIIMVGDLRAQVHLDLGEHDRAVDLLWQCFDLGESAGAGAYPAYEACRLIGALRESGDLGASYRMAGEGLAAMLQSRPIDADALGSLHLERARCEVLLGRPAEAAVSFRKARHHLQAGGNAAELAMCEAEMREAENREAGMHEAGMHEAEMRVP